MTHFTDTKILTGLVQNDNEVINYLYKEYFPMVTRIVTQNRGDQTDASDVFQDALMVLIKSVKRNGFGLSCTVKTFLYSICRNMWLQTLERNHRIVDMVDLDDFCILEDSAEYEDYLFMQKWIVQKHFLRMSEKCQQILLLYFDKVPMGEIARTMGYKSTKYASKRRHECSESLVRRVMNDPNYKKI